MSKLEFGVNIRNFNYYLGSYCYPDLNFLKMKYYKLLDDSTYGTEYYKVGQIYEENFLHPKLSAEANRVINLAKLSPHKWQECTADEYYLQEGKLPDEYLVYGKTSEDCNAILNYIEKFIKVDNCHRYLNNEYFKLKTIIEHDDDWNYDSHKNHHCLTGVPIVQFSIWDKLTNKNKMNTKTIYRFKTEKELSKLISAKYGWDKSMDYLYGKEISQKFYDDVQRTNCGDYDGWTISTDMLIKIEETMGKKIIGLKLKADCLKYNEACKEITGMSFDFISGKYTDSDEFHTRINETGTYDALKKAGVLDLWFEPVYEEVQFKVGDWVVIIANTNSSMNKVGELGTITTSSRSNDEYRVLTNSNYTHSNWSLKSEIRLATPEEIKEAELNELLEKARKRYPKGTRFKSISGVNRVSSGNIDWFITDDLKKGDAIQTGPGEGLIYDKGIWAEIITTPNITINGYPCEFKDDYVNFGCQTISKETIIQISGLQQSYDVDFTQEKSKIKEIAEYYLNK